MSIQPFNLGYPKNGTSLGSSKVPIRNNIDGTFLTLSVDHQNANEANPGYHTDIHMVPEASNPAAVPGIGQLYSNTVGSDQQLFYESGLGVISQITNNVTPTTGNNGYTYLPGGLIIQWGVTAGSFGSTVAVLFTTSNIDFPNNVFNIQITARGTTPGTCASILASSVATTGFTINNSNSAPNGYYWFAIGN